MSRPLAQLLAMLQAILLLAQLLGLLLLVMPPVIQQGMALPLLPRLLVVPPQVTLPATRQGMLRAN